MNSGNTLTQKNKTIWVCLPYATFGIEVENGRVTDAAPIGRWMIGKDTQTIRNWIENRGGYWEVLTHEGDKFD